jgi:hypothetical protein
LLDWREGRVTEERESSAEAAVVAMAEGLAEREKRKKKGGGDVDCAISPHCFSQSHEGMEVEGKKGEVLESIKN